MGLVEKCPLFSTNNMCYRLERSDGTFTFSGRMQIHQEEARETMKQIEVPEFHLNRAQRKKRKRVD